MNRDYSRLALLVWAAAFAVHMGFLPNPLPGIVPVGPIPADAFRVLFVEETSDRHKLTAAQQKIFLSSKVRDYLNRKCPKGLDGKTPEWRVFDKDDPLEFAPPVWKEIWAASQPFKAVPCVIVLNGTRGETFPLPANEDETLILLKKYGGE